VGISLPNSSLAIRDEEQNDQYLDKSASCGNRRRARLLLYTPRALHYLKPALASEGDTDTAVLETAFKALSEVNVVATEFVPEGDEGSSCEAPPLTPTSHGA